MLSNSQSNSLRTSKNSTFSKDKILEINSKNKRNTYIMGPNIIRNDSKFKYSYNKIISINDSGHLPDPIKLTTSNIYQNVNLASIKSNSKPRKISNNKFAINMNKNFNNFLKKKPEIKNNFLKNSVYSVVSDSSFSHRLPISTNNNQTSANYANFSNRTHFNELNFLYSFDAPNQHYTTNETVTENSVEEKNQIKSNSSLKNNFMAIKNKIPIKIKEKVNNIRLYTKPQILVEDSIKKENDANFEKNLISPTNNHNSNFTKSINIPHTQFNKINTNFINFKKVQPKLIKNENFNFNSTFSINNKINTKENIFKQIKDKIKKISNNKVPENKIFVKNNIYNSFNKISITKFEDNKIQLNDKNKLLKNKSRQVPKTLQTLKLPIDMNSNEKEMEYDRIYSSIGEDQFSNNNDSKSKESSLNISKDQSESGVLTFDEVKDIITCINLKNFDLKDRSLFYKNDYQKFIATVKGKYMNALFSNKNDVEILMDSSKSFSTKDSSSNKKNFISVIKYGD